GLVFALAAASACSSDDPGPGTKVNPGGSGGAAGASGAGALGGFGAQGGSLSVDSGGGSGGSRDSGLDGPVCGAVEHTSAQLPVDLFIMLDKSTPMLDPAGRRLQ